MVKRKFNCTPQELFAACLIAWEICRRYIDQFTAFKPKYNSNYVSERLEELRNMMELPDRNRRTGDMEVLRTQLRKLNDDCIEFCLKVKRHMDEVWEGEDLKSRLKQAGFEEMISSRRYQFENTQVMMASVGKFMNDNAEALLAGQNMAADFPEAFEKLSADFRTLYATYLSRTNAGNNTTEVITALNKLFDDLSNMLSDGKVIFRKDKLLKSQFSFDAILSTVSSNGWAGIKGILTLNGKPYTPVEGLQLSLSETGETAIPDEDGRFQFNQLKSGTYTLDADAPGFAGKVYENILVNTGSYTQLNIDLMPRQEVPLLNESDSEDRGDPGS